MSKEKPPERIFVTLNEIEESGLELDCRDSSRSNYSNQIEYISVDAIGDVFMQLIDVGKKSYSYKYWQEKDMIGNLASSNEGDMPLTKIEAVLFCAKLLNIDLNQNK